MLESTIEGVVGNALRLGHLPDRAAQPIHHEDGCTFRVGQPRESLKGRLPLHELLGEVVPVAAQGVEAPADDSWILR